MQSNFIPATHDQKKLPLFVLVVNIVLILSIFVFAAVLINRNIEKKRNQPKPAEESINQVYSYPTTNEYNQANYLSDPYTGSRPVAPTPNLEVIYPKGGEVLCKEKPTLIQWNAPADMESVYVYLIVSNYTSSLIGVFPANSKETSNAGVTAINWDFKNNSGYTVEDGDVYKIWISGMYNGQNLDGYSPGIFSIQTCAGQ